MLSEKIVDLTNINESLIELSDTKVIFKKPNDWTSKSGKVIPHHTFKKYLRTDIKDIFKSKGINDPYLQEREIVAQVFPFKINQHIIDQINWNKYESDPIFQLTFPQKEMLLSEEIERIKTLMANNASRETIAEEISKIRTSKNPAPANQAANRPFIDSDDEPEFIDGLQHKYKKIVLMFHKNAQTCHAYCTYCFRFNQFVGKDKFLEEDHIRLHKYLKAHPEISDVLMTGGDPATMKSDVWKKVLLPLLEPEYDHIQTIRMGTKALTYHPYRFLTDPDADELIELFDTMRNHGKHISIMGHFSHYQELGPVTLEAVRRLREEAGATIRTQSPVMRHINNDPDVWAKMWDMQIQNGMIPYYMFIARDTGAQNYFEITLSEALDVYQNARKQVSGLGHTARGPSMSSGPGKISVVGRETVAGEDVFILKFLQGRNEDWCDRVFFAKYDEKATWIDQLTPAFGEKKFFFEDEYNEILSQKQKKYNEMVNAGTLS
tara:strand:+ start:769 stop:2244 length:1476 start_codon:yes stop_codon:yes gene_type:complete